MAILTSMKYKGNEIKFHKDEKTKKVTAISNIHIYENKNKNKLKTIAYSKADAYYLMQIKIAEAEDFSNKKSTFWKE